MTREEAVKILENHINVHKYREPRAVYILEALEMAIQALEQKPCEDCISREVARDLMYHKQEPLDEYDLDSLPPAQPVQKWIPVSERLPEEETDVLICNRNGDIELSRGSYSTEVEDEEGNDFIWYTSGWRFGKVIAWMPLPKSYESQESEETDADSN